MRKWLLILGYARRHGGILLCAFPLAVISAGLAVLQPWPMKLLVDNVLGPAPLPPFLATALKGLSLNLSQANLLALVALTSLALFAAGKAVAALLSWISIKGSWGTVYSVAEDVFSRLQKRSLTFHRKNTVGELMSRVLGDSRCAQGVLENMLFAPAVALITITGMLILMIKINVWLTLLAFAATPFSWPVSALTSRRLRTAVRVNREIEGQIQSQLQQTLAGIGVVQAFGQEEREGSRFKTLAESHIKSQKANLLLGAMINLGTGLAAVLVSSLVLWLIAREVLAARVSLGSALLFLAYFGTLQGQLGVLRNQFTTVQLVGESASRVALALDTPEEISENLSGIPLPKIRGDVELCNVTAGYDGKPVLRAVSLRVAAGQTVAIVGRTGSGKTTLMNLIPRLEAPWEGSVLIDGCDLRDVQLQSLREQIAMVLQEPFLCAASVADNIAYGCPGASRAEIETAARVACAHEFICALSQGYDTVIGERGTTLSGGMKQRLAIARAVLKNSSILIMDEPSSALDAETEKLLFDALRNQAGKRTMFVITHRLSTVGWADLIVVMKDGQIVEMGSPGDLRARGGHYAQMHETAAELATTGDPDSCAHVS